MTALKKSEDRQAYVLRFFSTRKEERLVPLHLDRTRFSRVEKAICRSAQASRFRWMRTDVRCL